MDFHLGEMQQLIVDTARRLVEAETGLDQWRGRREFADGIDKKLWDSMAELGWMGLAVPEDAGGLGGSMEDVALLMIELGKGIVTEPIVSTAILAAHVLDRTLAGDSRQAWLERIATGSVRIALAQTDPDAEGLQPLSARATSGGYVLEGHKFMVLDAPSADHLILLAQMDGTPALFLSDAKSAAIHAVDYPLIDGSRASDLSITGLNLPAEALLASGEEALSVVESALDRARVALVAQSVGAMDATVRISADYARERQQFGQAIGKFQAIQHLAADMFVAANQARSALYAALGPIGAEASVQGRATSVAKVVSGLSGQTVSRNGIQIHGGYGVTDEYAVSHYYRRLLVLEKQYGGIDVHAGILAAGEMRS
jgi:alkylation response protein AidB-like acyl-CoA dehydrogenase